MNNIPDHFCPGCGAAQRAFPRYPWYFCHACLDLACDRDGRHIKFGNVSLSGGLWFRFSGDTDSINILSAICFIRDRPVFITEARFGGVLAQPLTGHHLIEKIRDEKSKITDLRGGYKDEHGS